MLKILYAVSPCQTQLILAQFAFEMCLAARNRQKMHKTPYFGVQGHLRSLNSVAIESQCLAPLLRYSELLAKNRKFCLPPSYLTPLFGVALFEFMEWL